jgi:putative Ca2+/H+ antiporter (TMEM165/GDT1 family)
MNFGIVILLSLTIIIHAELGDKMDRVAAVPWGGRS